MELKYPLFTILVILTYLLGKLIYWMIIKKRTATMILPNSRIIAPFLKKKFSITRIFVFVIELALIINIAILMGTPLQTLKREEEANGIDIMVNIDASLSMEDTDIKPTRFEAAKQALVDFIKGSTNDRIGVNLFSGIPLPIAPVTTSYDYIINSIQKYTLEDAVDLFGYDNDGTGIGNAIYFCTERFKQIKAPTKIVLLLTDGDNSVGQDPVMAAQYALANGVRVYGIFISDIDVLNSDEYGYIQSPKDETLSNLNNIVSITGGKAYQIKDANSIKNVLDDLSRLERNKLLNTVNDIKYSEPMPYLYSLVAFFVTYLFLSIFKKNA